jgi:DNA-binding transcriptional LysR family regulator
MKHLKAFHVFHVAAETSNYSKTAETLHITHGAVSKQIKILEEYLTTTLFCKKGRNVVLTENGKLLKQYTNTAFSALNDGVNLLKINPSHLEVSCEPTLTMRWLMPRLSNYYQESGVDVRLSTAGGEISLHNQGISMAIRRDDFIINPNYIVHHLVKEWVGPVFSPDYWNKIKNNLDELVFLHSHTRSDAWSTWLEKQSDMKFNLKINQTFDHFYFCLQAVIDGLGCAIGSYPLVADDIQKGRLIAPFGFTLSGKNYSIICKSREVDLNEISFIHWLQKHMSTCIPDH